MQDPNQDNNNNASNTTTDNTGSAVNVAGQAMFVSKALGVAPGYYGLSMNSLTAGFFGLFGSQKARTPNGDKAVDSWGYGFYTFVPIIKSKDGKSRAMTMSFEGEAYMAANMSFNAATSTNFTYDSQSAGLPVNPKAAKAFGMGGQVIFYPTQDLGITAGYLRRNAYNFGDYANVSNFQKYSTNIYANVAYDLNAAVRVAVEYENLNTHYGNAVKGTTAVLDSTAGSGSMNVGRLALYYFF